MDSNNVDTRDIMLGKILATVVNIEAKLERHVYRLDDLEHRVEFLEKKSESDSFQDRIVRGSIMAIMTGVGVIVLRVLGFL